MLRTILEGVILFALPFLAFGAYLFVRGQNPLHPGVWSKKALSWLTIAALLLCVAGIVFVGVNRQVMQGTIVPSHVDKDGRFVPGTFRQQ
jgi:peptidoglycan/LPS O-acetylase OafA/YrhL